MKILFSPSEAKTNITIQDPLNKNSFCCKDLYDIRMDVIGRYQDILNSKDLDSLKKLFGIKDEQKCFDLANINIKTTSTCKAIRRYSGVAYEYLKYETLTSSQKDFLDENTIIFSNLFGPMLAKDTIPMYKLKQNSSLKGFKTENFYKEHFSNSLDKLLENNFIIDLRAGFYEKFYKIPYPYITLKFIKNGKVVSHWAKAYRGIVLRLISQNRVESLQDFRDLEIDDLILYEIIEKKDKIEFIYEITN